MRGSQLNFVWGCIVINVVLLHQNLCSWDAPFTEEKSLWIIWANFIKAIWQSWTKVDKTVCHCVSWTQQCMKTAWGLNRGRKPSKWSSLAIKRTLIGSQQSFSDGKWHSVQCFSCLTFSEREIRLQLIVGSLYTPTHTVNSFLVPLEASEDATHFLTLSSPVCVMNISKNPWNAREKPLKMP